MHILIDGHMSGRNMEEVYGVYTILSYNVLLLVLILYLPPDVFHLLSTVDKFDFRFVIN